jgi:DNA topoisomerase IB
VRTLSEDPRQCATEARLRYVSCDDPGFSRKRKGSGFAFCDTNKKVIRATDVLKRIRSLAIPPAWEDVWICTYPNGHLQATGIDSRGRRQYRYHEAWRAIRDEAKYERLASFARTLPRIRARLDKDLRLPGLPLCGNARNCRVSNCSNTLARRESVAVGSEDVNEYLQSVSGQPFTAKDFRTWAGTVLASIALSEMQRVDNETVAKKNVVTAVEAVAKMLGNTAAICRKCYVHPAVITRYLDGTLAASLKGKADSAISKHLHQLKPEEAAVLAFLSKELARRSA